MGDLGLSKRAEATAGSTTIRATPGFVPPEILGLFTGQDPKRVDPFSADMWCLAETTFQALTNRGTFDTYGTLIQYVTSGLGFPSEALAEMKVSDHGIEFIQHLMAPSPLDRPSSEKAIKHNWIMIEDDYKSDDDSFQYVEEASVDSSPDPQGDITQPDIHWTTDLDTTNVEPGSQIQTEEKDQQSQNLSQRSHSSCQEALTDVSPATNPERRYVLVHDYHEDENHIEGLQSLDINSSRSSRSISTLTQVSLDRESTGTEENSEQGGTSEDRIRRDSVVPSPIEEPQIFHIGRAVETKARDRIRGRTKTRGHSISADFLSRRVLSELACRFELNEKVRPFNFRLAEILIILTREEKPNCLS